MCYQRCPPHDTKAALQEKGKVWRVGLPVPEAEILLLFPNKTWVHVISDKKGQAHIDLHTKNLPMTIYTSAPGFSAYLRHDWVPSSGVLSIER